MTKEEAESSMNKMIKDQEVDQYIYKKQDLKNKVDKIFSIIWGQCRSGVQSVLKGKANLEWEEEDVNCLWEYSKNQGF